MTGGVELGYFAISIYPLNRSYMITEKSRNPAENSTGNSLENSTALCWFLALLALVVYLTGVILSVVSNPMDVRGAAVIGSSGDFRFYDLLNFVTAARLFGIGLNPYDAHLQNSYLELALGESYPHALNCLYPPLALVVFYPLLMLPFSILRWVWLGLSILAAFSSALLILPKNSPRLLRIVFLLFVASFPPLLSAYYWGQFAPFLLLLLVVLTRSLQSGRWTVAAICLVVLSVKPQVCFLAVFAVFIWAIKTRNVQLLIRWFGVALLSFIGLELTWPGVHTLWLASFPALRAYAGISVTPTVPGFVRYLGVELGIDLGQVALSLTAALSLLFILPLIRASARPLRFWFEAGLVVSLVVSPYGWFQDQTVLLIPALSLIAMDFDRVGGALLDSDFVPYFWRWSRL
jgi:hypothetical protein